MTSILKAEGVQKKHTRKMPTTEENAAENQQHRDHNFRPTTHQQPEKDKHREPKNNKILKEIQELLARLQADSDAHVTLDMAEVVNDFVRFCPKMVDRVCSNEGKTTVLQELNARVQNMNTPATVTSASTVPAPKIFPGPKKTRHKLRVVDKDRPARLDRALSAKSLPPVEFSGKIKVIWRLTDAQDVVEELLLLGSGGTCVLGVDTETPPARKKGEVYDTALIQIATDSVAYLFQIGDFKATGTNPGTTKPYFPGLGILRALRPLFDSPNILKAGVGLSQDLKELEAAHFSKTGIKLRWKPEGIIDLDEIAREKGIAQPGIQMLTVRYFDRWIQKGWSKNSVQCSDWGVRHLSEKQKTYAATDAWISLQLYAPVVTLKEQIPIDTAGSSGDGGGKLRGKLVPLEPGRERQPL